MRPYRDPNETYAPLSVCAPHTGGRCREHRGGKWYFPYHKLHSIAFAPYECRPGWRLSRNNGWVLAGTHKKPCCSNFRQRLCAEGMPAPTPVNWGWCQECGTPSDELTCDGCFRAQRALRELLETEVLGAEG